MAYLDQRQATTRRRSAIIQSMLLDPRRGASSGRRWRRSTRCTASTGRGALLGSPEGPRLNVDHPIVRDHFINAYRGFIRMFRYANRPHLAEAARQAAVYRYRMPPSLFDSLMVEAIPQVTPHGLDYRRPQAAAWRARK